MRQEHWPHNLVSHASVKKPQKHSELSMLQYQEGFLAKILLEADLALLEPKVKKKMLFFHYISKLSYLLSWPQVLEVAAKFFRGLEHMRFCRKSSVALGEVSRAARLVAVTLQARTNRQIQLASHMSG